MFGGLEACWWEEEVEGGYGGERGVWGRPMCEV